jgi:transcriptional regulator of acetoin/glycerol metabolism
MSQGPNLPANPFYAAPAQRVALARQRFFEDGLRPSGMVNEAVLQSWSRCLRTHPNPARPAVFEPVTPSRAHGVLRSNRELLEAAGDELERLRATLAGTSCTAMLTDPQGVVIGTSFTTGRSHEQLMPIAARIGVNLAEEVVGTNAPGLTARSGQPSVVLGAEHFFANVNLMHCAAAPIRNVRGQLAGVLDLSSEGIPFGFDAASVVAHYAAEIENRLLCAQSTEHLVVRMQITPALLNTPMAALVGVTGDGRIDWLNGAAARLLGLTAPLGQRETASVEDSLGVSLARLIAMSKDSAPQMLHLPNGLALWVRCECRSRHGHAALHAAAPAPASQRPVAAPASASVLQQPQPTTLRATRRQTVVRVLEECDGNVSKAAQTLGVSRGLIYRHLRQRNGD